MNRPIVTVKQGKLQGILQENVLGSHYFAFKGIPFAAPPVGELRFKDPEPPISWDGIRDASKNSDVCLQLDSLNKTMIGSENCLYLNVYVPCNIYGTTRNPIMFWIHGGAFLVGSGNDTINRPDYLLAKEIILVSINYRLGAFGFLNLGHETASGNQALKDQIAALKWVKENIEVFGGDPENITIFGNSAGGACVHLLTLSPLSKGLFHKAISQSGIGTCSWAIEEHEPETNSFKLASILGNDSKDPETVIEFLRTVPADKIVKTQYHVLTSQEARISNVPFTPTIDKKAKRSLLPCPLYQLLDNDNNIPIILGHTSHEYLMFLKDTNEPNLQMIYKNIPLYVKKFTGLTDQKKIMQLTERIKQWYFNDKQCTKDNILFIIQFLGDIFLDIPIRELANSRRKKIQQAPIYFYIFSYIGSQITTTKLMGHDMPVIGASHSDDLSYLFYKPLCKVNDPKPPAIGTKDRKVMEAITSMWTNFAKTGNPTPVIDQNITTTWLSATKNAFNYLEIKDVLQCAKLDYINIFKESD